MDAAPDLGNQPDLLAERARERGARFLLTQQGSDGLWRDFDTPAGEASLWPTAFIGTALLSAGIGPGEVDRAAQALAARQNDDGGWGYNEDVPTDADSTAWALLFLTRMGCHGNVRQRAAACLIRHQRDEVGGIATYAESRPIRRYMGVGRWLPFWGWCRPHTEVTAVAGRALAVCFPGVHSPAADAAWRFVRSTQNAAGDWSSYWWTSPLYTTAEAVEMAVSRGDRAAVDRAAAWVLRTQTDRASSAFAAAMCLRILVSAAVDRRTIGRVVAGLLALQQADGGWPSHPIMRIPVPPDTDPNGERRWRFVRFGGGIEVGDQHRLFTSAACVAALAI